MFREISGSGAAKAGDFHVSLYASDPLMVTFEACHGKLLLVEGLRIDETNGKFRQYVLHKMRFLFSGFRIGGIVGWLDYRVGAMHCPAF